MADGEFKTMQEEAIRRVREMQRRSKNYVSPQQESPPPPPEPPPPKPQTAKPTGEKPLFNIGGIAIDEEKALIALMIYILYKNKADMKLLLGLGYLLL